MNNIAFLVSNIDPYIGGTERVTQTIAQNLSIKGYNVFFIFTSADNEDISKERKLKINPDNSSEQIAKSIEEYIECHQIQVVIVVNRVFQSPKFQKVFLLLKQKTSVKLIISLHAAPDNWVNKNKLGLVLPKVYIKEAIKSLVFKFVNPHVIRVTASYKIADKYLLLSKSYIKSFEDTYHIEDTAHKLIAIPNPCPFRDTFKDSNKENIVLVVSRMQEDQKRIYAVLKIWSLLYKDIPNWQLYIVGDGPDLPIYKRIARKMDRVRFEGHSNNVQDYYKRSKIFMMTSIWEGLPMTLIEAMHYGCVPIAFDSFAALHDVIADGQTGYIIDNNDLKDFVSKLKALTNGKVEEMREHVLAQENKFDVEPIINIWDKELKNLCITSR